MPPVLIAAAPPAVALPEAQAGPGAEAAVAAARSGGLFALLLATAPAAGATPRTGPAKPEGGKQAARPEHAAAKAALPDAAAPAILPYAASVIPAAPPAAAAPLLPAGAPDAQAPPPANPRPSLPQHPSAVDGSSADASKPAAIAPDTQIAVPIQAATPALPPGAGAAAPALSQMLAAVTSAAAVSAPAAAPQAAPPAAVAAAAAVPASSAAAQVAPVLVRLASGGGTQQVMVALHPAELGRVEVRVGRDAAGGVQVAVLAERPETLHALQHDQAQLGQALDRAGVPAPSRSVSFALAPPPVASVAAAPDAQPGGGDPQRGPAQGDAGGAAAGGGGGRGGDSPPGGQNRGGTMFADPGEAASAESGAELPWVRYGVDITA